MPAPLPMVALRTHMNSIQFILLLIVSFASLRAGEFDKEKLLPLLRFPGENFEVGFAVTAEGVRLLNNEIAEVPLPEQIARAELRRAIRPEEPQHYRDLAFLHQKAGNTNVAGELLAEAAERYRVTMAETNRHATAFVEGYAEVLRASGRSAQAEKLLRAQVENAPKDHRAWAALGDHHALAGYVVLTGKSEYSDSPLEVQHTVMHQTYTQEQLATVDKHFNEALVCYHRAIHLEKDAPELYRKRMVFRLHGWMLRDVAGKPGVENAHEVATRNFFANSLPEMQQIARIESNNPEAIAARMFTEVIAEAVGDDLAKILSENVEERMSADNKAKLRKGIAELKKLSRRGDARSRQVALVSIGFFQFLLGAESAGEKSIRSAIALDETHPLAWETLGGLYLMREPPRLNDLFLMARERTKYHDTARNRFIAAKAAEKLGKSDEAMEDLQAALKLDPNHGNSQLAACVLLLREGSDESIKKAHALVGEMVERKHHNNDQWRELMIVGGVMFAVGGQPETAREWFETLRQHAPGEERAAVALAAWKE